MQAPFSLRLTTKLVTFFGLIGLFVCLGCSSELTDPADIGAIGSAGGVVRPEIGSSVLEIPPQALDNSLILTIKEAPVTDPPANHITLSDAISVEPAPVAFGAQQFAFLTVPLKIDAVPANANLLNLKVFRKTDKGWEAHEQFSIKEHDRVAIVWLQETGTYAAFLPKP